MPCYTPPPTPQEEYRHWEKKLRHDSPTADAFCELIQELELNHLTVPLTEKAAKWWNEHKERDRKRLKEELKVKKEKADKVAALEKLSPYERRLLGIF